MLISLDDAVVILNEKTNKKATINLLLQAALNGSVVLSILYDGKAKAYEAGEDSIKEIYGWFDILPRFLADIINHKQSNINILMNHNSQNILLEGVSEPLTATVDNIFITEHRLNELISLNVETPLNKVNAVNKADAPPIKGMSKRDIAKSFDGVYWSYDQWKANLGDAPQWLKSCRVSLGSKKLRASHLWNPVLIALALMDKHIPMKRLDLVFIGLKDWQPEWQDKTELER